MVGQVNPKAVEAIRDRRARGTARLVVGPEHEVIDEKLRAPSEEVFQRGAPFVCVEPILLVRCEPTAVPGLPAAVPSRRLRTIRAY
jgi:hypothetical protein